MVTVLIVLFGIFLPAITLAIEFSTGMCAEAFFDPIATLGHVFLVAFVPGANLLALLGSKCNWIKWRKTLLWANGIAIGIALIYMLVFLPIMPLAFFAIFAMGMGFLPLAPFFSLICAFVLRNWLINISELNPAVKEADSTAVNSRSLAPLLIGGSLGVILVLLSEAAISITLIAAEMTTSESPTQRARGLSLLRRLGDKDELLRMCYRDGGGNFGDFGFRAGKSRSMCGFIFSGMPRLESQKLFFRVTGKAFNALPPPRGVNQFVRDDFDFDPDVGGQTVAGVRKGLSLSGSSMDVKLQPDSAVSYTEWTMIFQNNHWQQREARAKIMLPLGGVVSRVTLWINGEPHEAAFAGAGQVREAYQKVAVVQRRDPLLVTWASADRVMIQCFPVPPNGEMKICIGITAPLLVRGDDTAVMRLPCFAERNFSIANEEIHSLWVESEGPYKYTPTKLNQTKGDDQKRVLRFTLSDKELASTDARIAVSHSPAALESWTPDPKNSKKFIMQKIVAKTPPAKRQLILIVDGSAGMAGHIDAIAESLIGLPKETELKMLVASDDVIDLSDIVSDRSATAKSKITERLRAVASKGGCDNIPAILQALRDADEGDKTIVWIHASQPILLQSGMAVTHWMERDPQVLLYDLSVSGGPNHLAEELKIAPGFRAVPRLGLVADDLKCLLMLLTGQAKEYVFERSQLEEQPPSTPQASSHLADLWAADQVLKISGNAKPSNRVEAVKLAASYRIVTPVSGAVVLENRQQYKDSNLEPPDDADNAITPEPATWILILMALPGVYWYIKRIRKRK